MNGDSLTPQQLEDKVNRVLERVVAKQPTEDSLVELKREWPEPFTAARQIGGLANAAGGDPILWIIGADEKGGVVPGAAQQELSDWIAKAKSYYDGVAPPLLQNLTVHWQPVSVVALRFETRQAPYVLRRQQSQGQPQQVSHEVPWREGNLTRSALRRDLLRVLVPTQSLPDVEVVSGSFHIKMYRESATAPELLTWVLFLRMYIAPRSERVVLPFHRAKAWVRLKENTRWIQLGDQKLRAYHGSSPLHSMMGTPTIANGPTEVVLSGPGTVELAANLTTEIRELLTGPTLSVIAMLQCTHSPLDLVVRANMGTVPARERLAAWEIPEWQPESDPPVSEG